MERTILLLFLLSIIGCGKSDKSDFSFIEWFVDLPVAVHVTFGALYFIWMIHVTISGKIEQMLSKQGNWRKRNEAYKELNKGKWTVEELKSKVEVVDLMYPVEDGIFNESGYLFFFPILLLFLSYLLANWFIWLIFPALIFYVFLTHNRFDMYKEGKKKYKRLLKKEKKEEELRKGLRKRYAELELKDRKKETEKLKESLNVKKQKIVDDIIKEVKEKGNNEVGREKKLNILKIPMESPKTTEQKKRPKMKRKTSRSKHTKGKKKK